MDDVYNFWHLFRNFREYIAEKFPNAKREYGLQEYAGKMYPVVILDDKHVIAYK